MIRPHFRLKLLRHFFVMTFAAIFLASLTGLISFARLATAATASPLTTTAMMPRTLVQAPPPPCTNGSITSIVVDGMGNFYVGGTFTLINNIPASRIAKWDGTNWSALGDGSALANNGVDNNVNALALSGNNLYVGGTFQQARSDAVTTVPASRIAVWNIMTSTWSVLGDPMNVADNGVNNSINAIAINGSNVYVGGFFTEARTNAGTKPPTSRVALWNGTAWSALGDGSALANNGTSNPVTALAIDSLGNVFAG